MERQRISFYDSQNTERDEKDDGKFIYPFNPSP